MTYIKEDIFATLPHSSRKELVDLRKFMNSAFNSNAEIICEDHVDTVLYQFRDFTNQYAFNVKFNNFNTVKNCNSYQVYFKPASLTSIDGNSIVYTFTQVRECFIRWINLVKQMHQITEEYYDPNKKFYDEQFAEFFANNDEDAATNPFEIEKQELLFYFLTYAENRIKKSSDITEDNRDKLIVEVSQLRENIPNLTKKRFVSALSNLAKNIKKAGNKLFYEIFDVIKKEAIKQLLYGGLSHIPNDWMNLLS